MSRAGKGSAFEREICKRLSAWWSLGLGQEERSDIFWRSSQSGGRATQRAKSGRKTFGSYGDIAAVDPIGQPLIQMFTIELKRGSSHGCPGDLLDFKEDNRKHPWMKCLAQAVRSHEAAGSKAWLMICKRDRRTVMVFMETYVRKELQIVNTGGSYMRLHLSTKQGRMFLIGMPMEQFLLRVTPKQIISCSKL